MKTITYTFPSDFRVAELRGKTFTGGNLGRSDGKWQKEPDVVDFGEQRIGNKNVVLKVQIADRPEFEAILAVHKAEKETIEARLAAIGWPIYQATWSKAVNQKLRESPGFSRGEESGISILHCSTSKSSLR